MHNNFYFLRQLSQALKQNLSSAVISECFSQNKEELIIRFEIGRKSTYLKASLHGQFSCLSFPNEFQRARKNSIDLFERIIGEHVEDVRQYENERSFSLVLSNQVMLLFKMHGNRSNLLLFEDGQIREIFKKNIKADNSIQTETLDRHIDWTFEHFLINEHQLQKTYFTFGKLVWHYLDSMSFREKESMAKWQMIQDVRRRLESPVFYLTEVEGKPALSMVPFGNLKKEFADPIEVVNEFYYTYTQIFAFTSQKERVLSTLKTRLQSSKNYHEKTFSKLVEIEKDSSYKVWADVLMANLHQIKVGMEKITLANFYNADHPVEIKLKKDLSPQKNAELFYKKAKNQQTEIDFLQKAITQKEKEIATTEKQIKQVSESTDLKSLRAVLKSNDLDLTEVKDAPSLPYHEFIYNGYKIWVGRNAEANDILTLKYGFKEDLWLHAKDVSGSHVLIKHQAGKNFPKDVIERAAELAAYNSKRRTDTLCPVIVTPKKFVRKRKGDPAGAVVVDRENVIMVEPRLG